MGHKRFSLEGAESLIPMLDVLLDRGRGRRRRGVVIGMAHRGRLNVLANVIGKSYGQIFREFEGELDPRRAPGPRRREVPPRRSSGSHTAPSGRAVRLTLACNPSHLEAVDPVVEGIARAQAGPPAATPSASACCRS